MLEWICARGLELAIVVVVVAVLLAWLQPDAGLPPQRGVLDQRGRAG